MISGLKDFLSASSLRSALKCPLCALAVGYSLIISCPCVFFARLLTLFSNEDLGISARSWMGMFRRFASIRSAIFSSAISIVMYRTLDPLSKTEALAIWHMNKDFTDTCPSKSDVKSLVRKTTFRNLVRILKIKGNTIFFLVIRLISFFIIF